MRLRRSPQGYAALHRHPRNRDPLQPRNRRRQSSRSSAEFRNVRARSAAVGCVSLSLRLHTPVRGSRVQCPSGSYAGRFGRRETCFVTGWPPLLTLVASTELLDVTPVTTGVLLPPANRVSLDWTSTTTA